MRCITLADSLRANGHKVQFICRNHEGNSNNLLTEKGYLVHILPDSGTADFTDLKDHCNWPGTAQDIDARETLEILNQFEQVDWLVVDHNALDSKWENIVSTSVNNLFVFDDLASRTHKCNILCDQSPSRTRVEYQHLIPESCKTLLGLSYAPIRGQFPRLRNYSLQYRLKTKQVEKVLITANQFTTSILEALESLPGSFKVDMMIVPSWPQREELAKKIQKYHFPIDIRTNTIEMAELMANSDIAVGSAGTSALERCVMGLPSIVLTTENETTVGSTLEKSGAALLLHTNELENSDALVDKLSTLFNDSRLRSRLSQHSAALIDGYGSSRLYAEIMDLRSKDGFRIGLRPAEMTDAETILEWQSDPVTRRFSRNPAVPTHEEHMNWMKGKLSDPNSVFSIIVEDAKPVGVFRLDKHQPMDLMYEISVLVAPERHQQGIAKHAVLLMNSLLPDTPKAATVLPDNKASHSLFNSSGFQWTGNKYEWWPVGSKEQNFGETHNH